MKSSKISALQILILFLICVLASCTTKPDLNTGLKVILQLSLKDAILSSAINPKDSMLLSVLNHTPTQPSIEEFTTSFIEQYSKLYPGHNPAIQFPLDSDRKIGQTSQEDLKKYLLKMVNNKRMRTAEVTKARIQAFCGTKQQDIKIDYKGALMTIYVHRITNEKSLNRVFNNRDGIRFWATKNIKELADYFVRIDDTLSHEFKANKKTEIKKIDTSTEPSLTDLAKDLRLDKEYDNPLFDLLQPAVKTDGSPMENVSFIGIANLKDTAKINSYFKKKTVSHILPEHVQLMWGNLPGRDTKPKMIALYAIVSTSGRPLINNNDIKEAYTKEYNGRLQISISMNALGALKWQKATAANINKAIAIELNNYVYSAPIVMNEIWGGHSSVTGDFTEEEMNDMVNIINTGGFPIKFEIKETEPFKK